MKQYLIPHEGRFFKANLHAHSTFSDGRLTPAQMKSLYQTGGYSIIAFTDHNVLQWHKELDAPDFLALCGYEVDVCETAPDGYSRCCHLCAISRDPEHAVLIPRPTAYSPAAINATIRALREADFIVHYNHPSWSAEEPENYLQYEGLTAFEIYNHGCEVASGDGDDRAHYAALLNHGKRLFCIATDDNHNAGGESDAMGGFTMIKAPILAYDAIIKALDAGDYYCSTGPEIHDLYLEDGRLCLDCSPVRRIALQCKGIGSAAGRCAEEDCLTHFEWEIPADAAERFGFLRFVLTDSQGRRAFTNPYYPA